jgi:glycosyltransferase involved in cell wall biosynthesis
VTFIGRLGREKGILDLLDAWRALDRHDAVLFVVGPDMPGNALDVGAEVRAAAAAMPPGRVVLHGPAADVRPMLAATDVFVQPSHYEAFGLSVVEAMAAGCAVVATQVGGMAEYLRDGDNALLCPPHAPDALAAQIARALDTPALLQDLRRRARETATAHFDDEVVTRRWLQFLRRVASGTRNGPHRWIAGALLTVMDIAGSVPGSTAILTELPIL